MFFSYFYAPFLLTYYLAASPSILNCSENFAEDTDLFPGFGLGNHLAGHLSRRIGVSDMGTQEEGIQHVHIGIVDLKVRDGGDATVLHVFK